MANRVQLSRCSRPGVRPVHRSLLLDRLSTDPSSVQISKVKLWRAGGILDHYRRERGLTVSSDTTPSTLQAKPATPIAVLDDECPVECVHEIKSLAEFHAWQGRARPGALLVVDYYKTSCGACKYIAPGFIKLCRATDGHDTSVIFLKHNVNQDDEDDELSDLAAEHDVKMVPLFMFFKDGQAVERFATRDKTRLAATINQLVGTEVVHM